MKSIDSFTNGFGGGYSGITEYNGEFYMMFEGYSSASVTTLYQYDSTTGEHIVKYHTYYSEAEGRTVVMEGEKASNEKYSKFMNEIKDNLRRVYSFEDLMRRL